MLSNPGGPGGSPAAVPSGADRKLTYKVEKHPALNSCGKVTMTYGAVPCPLLEGERFRFAHRPLRWTRAIAIPRANLTSCISITV